ncbi:NADH-quinone oxidoreductase subunit L [Pseudonocardia sp. H11422]|uniref:NADH-quinone oxidoreductase subunit 5 family protein n=1 Tax=Pseudonocardia sp. H11422 TaxID=2835866 RepID=UPI0027E2F7E4|nr:proton-conducting transporter membrane subunit [Pseudonocardia sp. H11422]
MLLWSLIAVPLAVGGLLAPAGRRAGRVAPAVGLLVAAVTAVLAVVAAVRRPVVDAPFLAGIRAGLAVDDLSALMVVTVAGATLAVLCFAAGEEDLRSARFVGLMLLFAGAMLVTVTATTLPVLLMAWEVMGAASWALIGYWWRDLERVRAAHTAFLSTRAADLGLYIAAGAALAGGVGSLALAQLPVAAGPWLHVATAGMVLAALGKSAQLPFSYWLSGAMAGPSPVSALLHSATMVAAGAYLLLRLAPLLEVSVWAAPVVAWVGAATALLLGLVAVAQTDLKQLLAASTCAQIGYMVLAAGVGGVGAGALQLIAHAATKSLLFLAAGAWLVVLGTQHLGELRGAARRFPLVGVTFTVGAASLAGLPPLSLWVSKDAVLAAALTRSPALYAAGLAAAVVSAVYSAKALWWVWQPAPDTAAAAGGTGRVSAPTRPPLVVLAVLAATLGALAWPLAVSPAPAAWELVLSAALAVLAVVVTLRLGDRLPAPAPLAGWLGLERAARAAVVRPTLALAHAAARFDDQVLDRAVTAVASGTVALARALDRRGEWSVDGAIRAIAAAGLALGRLARRPQTGQIHQYYAQAAGALALLALFLVVVR